MGSCCTSVEEKAEISLSKFPVKTIDQLNQLASSNLPSSVIGRAIPSNTKKLISPVSERECIYYKIQAFEVSAGIDFYLFDPSRSSQRLYVPASSLPVKEFGNYSGTYEGIGKGSILKSYTYKPAIHEILVQKNRVGVMKNFIRYRFQEYSIPIFEQIVILSKIQYDDVMREFISTPISKDCLDNDYFKDNNWSSQEISLWKSLFGHSTVIVTNHIDSFQNQFVPPFDVIPSFIPTITAPLTVFGSGGPPPDKDNHQPQIYQPVAVQSYPVDTHFPVDLAHA